MRAPFSHSLLLISSLLLAKFAGAAAYTYSVTDPLPATMVLDQAATVVTTTITNTSGGPLGLGATITGDQNWLPGASTCVINQSLTNGASCTVTGTYDPALSISDSSLFLSVSLYPGIVMAPVIIGQTTVSGPPLTGTINTSLSTTNHLGYRAIQISNDTNYSQDIILSGDAASDPSKVSPCTYAAGENQCPVGLDANATQCPADVGGTMTLSIGQSCDLWYKAIATTTGTTTSTASNGTINLNLTPSLSAPVNTTFNYSYSSDLYVGGSFTQTAGVNPTTLKYIARWDGATWYPVAYGLNSNVQALALDQTSDLYAGGTFTFACSASECSTNTLNQIGRWDGNSWNALVGDSSSTINISSVNALAFDSIHNYLYVGGKLGIITHSVNAANLIYWDTVNATWTGLGVDSPIITGPAGAVPVNALAFDNTRGVLYAGGAFTATTASATLPYIAEWTGSAWRQMASGLDGTVNSLSLGAVTTSPVERQVLIGGSFASAVSPTVTSAKLIFWNGSSFVAPGFTPNGTVQAVATLSSIGSDYSYFGGAFINVNSSAYNKIGYLSYLNSVFTGSALGGTPPGLNNTVFTLAFANPTSPSSPIWIGGSFTATKTNPATTLNRITEWNGATWSTVGSGPGLSGGNVLALLPNVPSLVITAT